MINTILGSKGENSQTFVQGSRVPVTKVAADHCVVTQIKNMDRDGYWAVQLGFSTKRAKNTSKPLQGHLKKSQNSNLKTQDEDAKTSPPTKASADKPAFPRYIREIRLKKEPEVNVGDIIKASDIFKPGDVVAVTGVTKGKGFAGVVKKHGFAGGPRTHGQSDRERAPGSVGQTTTPGRVYKGKRMAGRMGGVQVTIKNLHVISVDPENGTLEISGQIPGAIGSLIRVKRIKAGSLKELEHEVVAQVVEGEAPSEEGANKEAGEAKTETPKAEVAAPKEGGQENG